MAIAVGTRLGRYEVRAKLGEGGMGEVYLAQDTQLRRPVAPKLLPSAFSQNKDRLRRFEQEAFAVAALNHPNIAHVYEIGEAVGEHDQAFQWLEKSYQDHTSRMTILQVDPFLDPLRSDPRFANLVRRVGLQQ